jgi:hypothetical protein
MPVRNTSKASFLENQATGIASAQRIRVLAYVRARPGSTLRDIYEGLNFAIDYSAISARANELKEMGEIVEDGCKKNSSGRSANCLYVKEFKNVA